MTQPSIDTDLETAILAVYQAPLVEFISRRDALAKQLRADQRREDATLVKALRKPSRMAWVLDSIAHEGPASIEQLAAAIAEAQTGVDLRAALEAVKDAVRAAAAVGARAAVRAGQPVEPNAIAMAVHAVIGDANAFADFRAGRLVDVPASGGLDMLTALTVSPSPAKPTLSSNAAPPKTEPAQADPHAERAKSARAELAKSARAELAKSVRAELAKSARAELHRAEQLLADVREQSAHAVESLRDAAARLDAAERALLEAQTDVQSRRHDVERGRRGAESAAANLEQAERRLDAARARMAEFEEA